MKILSIDREMIDFNVKPSSIIWHSFIKYFLDVDVGHLKKEGVLAAKGPWRLEIDLLKGPRGRNGITPGQIYSSLICGLNDAVSPLSRNFPQRRGKM